MLALACLPGVASGATARSSATGGGSDSSRASLTGLDCQHALMPANREFSDTAVMRAMGGTRREGIRFRLVRRPAKGGAFTPVHGPGLGTWLTRQGGGHPGDVWRVIHTVSDLSAPAVYRFIVGFRWIGSDGTVLARASRTSHTCFQPELRPDLVVRSITVSSDSADSSDDIYRARIRDAGATGAGPFQVQLGIQDQHQVEDTRRVAHIDPHQTLVVKLIGAVCNSSDPPTVTADPRHRVHVYTRAHASLTATCPAST